MVGEILKLCKEKGFFLDKETLRLLSELDKNKAYEIIEKISRLKLKERVITQELYKRYINSPKDLLNNDNLIDEKIKLLSNSAPFSKKINVMDFVNHFQVRYKAIRGILEIKSLENLSSIRRIGINNGAWTIIVLILNKRMTKNKNLLIEVEDLTGKSIILVNRENLALFSQAKELLLDDIVAFRVSGSNKMLFASDIIYPDAVLSKKKYSSFDEYVAFSGDFHVGSKMFLEKKLLRFIKWLNGGIGDKRQKEIAKKVKYLFLAGDNIDGVGIYQGQEKFLNIRNCKEQYKKVEEILKKIRKDVQIIMCPGQHDAVWVGEPQSIIPEKWAPGLHQMENLYLVPNPALVEIIGGFKVLMYHGAGINRFIDEIPEIRTKYGHKSPTKVVKEMLKRRHLAPIHGLMDYIPCENKDPMVIDIVPDIIVTADQHRAEIDSYNNILMVASSCWQSITPFEEKIGNVPDPCKVPLFNLKTREVKIMDFSRDDDLVCKMEEKNE